MGLLVTAIDTYARVEVWLAERVHRSMSGEPSRPWAVGRSMAASTRPFRFVFPGEPSPISGSGPH